jgi:hypothetical protein
MSKSFLSPDGVSNADIEDAYQVYKAATLEQQFKANLGEVFSDRFGKEIEVEKAEVERNAFDAREPMSAIQKAISTLNERIDNLTQGESGTSIQKSAGQNSSIPIPSTDELANMDWDEVHRMATAVWRGE